MENKVNLEEIKQKLDGFMLSKKYQKHIKIFLIKTTKAKLEIYQQQTNDSTKKILFEMFYQQFSKNNFLNREICDYDEIIEKKNTHTKILASDFVNIQKTIEKFNDEKLHNQTTKGLKEIDFQYYLIDIDVNEKADNYKVIGSFSSIKRLKKSLFLGNFTDNGFEIKENNSFGFNKKIELLIIDNETIVINQAEKKFQNLFKMQEEFSNMAKKILEDNSNIKQIFSESTLEILKDKVQNGKRIATRLIKITKNKERFRNTCENLDKIQEIIDDKKHPFNSRIKDVKIEKKQLSVEKGKEIQLIEAISDADYIATISGFHGIDEAR